MFNFTGKRKLWYIISLLIIIPGIISMILQGFNTGIDFTGGSIVQIRFEQAVDPGDIREVVNEFVSQTPMIQEASNNSYNIRTVEMSNEESQNMLIALEEKFGALNVESTELIGPVVGRELVKNARNAVLIALVFMLIYIAIRFKFNYAIAAILALCHDVLVTLSVFSIFQIEVDSAFIAAILTVVGYSINNTIVIFDRIRENIRNQKSSKVDYASIINASIRQTLARSINTVIAVLIFLFSLVLFGGETTKIFAFALILGNFAGFYSSLVLAGSFLLEIINFRNRPRQIPAAAGKK